MTRGRNDRGRNDRGRNGRGANVWGDKMTRTKWPGTKWKGTKCNAPHNNNAYVRNYTIKKYIMTQCRLVSDQNRNSHFRQKPNIRQLKTTEYSISAEYSPLLPTFGRKSLIYCIHTATLVEFRQNLTMVSVFPYLSIITCWQTINSDQNTFRISG
jgi:hypothetical protein